MGQCWQLTISIWHLYRVNVDPNLYHVNWSWWSGEDGSIFQAVRPETDFAAQGRGLAILGDEIRTSLAER